MRPQYTFTPFVYRSVWRGHRTKADIEENDESYFKINSRRVVSVTDPDGPDFLGLEGGMEAQAADAVRAVVSWYNDRLLAEQRSPVPDEERVAELKGGRAAALADQQQLATADPEEEARIGEVYAARLKELNKS